MRFVVKRWGNSFGIHLAKTVEGVGPLHDGMVVEGELRPMKDTKNWKPYLVRGLEPDLSTRVDEILEEDLEERWGKRTVRPSS